MILVYKASNIAKAERQTGDNFFEVISQLAKTPSMASLIFLYQAGGATEEDFDEAIKNGFEAVLLDIMEGLNDAGFLGTKIDTEAMKAEMEKTKNSQKASVNSGKIKKA